MRVLIVTPEYPPDFGGGIGSFYGALVPSLEANGCQVTVLRGSAFVQAVPASNVDKDAPVGTLERDRFLAWCGRFQHFAMFPALRKHLAAAFAMYEQAAAGEHFDCIEVTDWGLLFLPWVLFAPHKVIVQLHGSCGQIAQHEPVAGREAEAVLTSLLEKVSLRGASVLSSYSRMNVTYWQELLGRPVQYQPPPVPVPAPPLRAAELPAGDWLTVGRIQKWKGPEIACAAWQILGSHAPVLRWLGRDAGDGASGGSLDTTLRSRYPAVWGARIVPEKSVPSASVRSRMQVAKAVLIPSTWDVFNLVAAEAMALGRPLVISDGAGASELVQDGLNAIVFRNGDAEALAGAVKRLQLLGEGELETMGAAAAATVAGRLDPAEIASQRMELYRDAPTSAPSAAMEWVRNLLLAETQTEPLRFLDDLPLKDLTRYVTRRGLAKSFRR